MSMRVGEVAGVVDEGADVAAVNAKEGGLSIQTTQAAMEDEVGVVDVEVVVATIMGRIVGMMDGVKDEVLLWGKIVGMADGVKDEVLLRISVIAIARHRIITFTRHRIIDHTSRIILTRMVVME
jgi:hypothetical protein